MAESSGPDAPTDFGGVPDTVRIGDDEVRLRDFQLGDEAQIAELFRAAFGGFYPAAKPVDELDYIRWFMEPRGSHKARITLAEIDSRIVAAMGHLGRPIRIGEAELYGNAGGIGAATHPDFQGRGINRARSRYLFATEDPPQTASVDTRTEGTRGRRTNPAPTNARMGVYARVLRPWPLAVEKSDRLRLPVYVTLAMWGRLRPLASSRVDVQVGGLRAFDERFGAFLERASATWDVIPMRTVEYLNWRFCDARAGNFVVRAAEEGSELVGYAVVHAIGSRGHIMDMLALPDRLDVVLALVSDSVRELRLLGSSAVECWMLQEHPYARVLRQAGFVRLPGRSADVDREVGWWGSGIGPKEQALLASPGTRTHLVRADFDAI